MVPTGVRYSLSKLPEGLRATWPVVPGRYSPRNLSAWIEPGRKPREHFVSRRLPLCDQPIADARRVLICSACIRCFQRIPPGSCELGGQPGAFDPEFLKELAYCRDCETHRRGFQLARG